MTCYSPSTGAGLLSSRMPFRACLLIDLGIDAEAKHRGIAHSITFSGEGDEQSRPKKILKLEWNLYE